MPSIRNLGTPVPAPRRTLPIVNPRFTADDVVVMGLDPGDEHVGITLGCKHYTEVNGTLEIAEPGWRVYETAEMNQDEFVRWFASNAAGIDVIYGEMFYLDKERAYALIGSTLPTSQLIGWVRRHCLVYAPHIEVNWQSNMVLTGPTAALLRKAGIRPVSPPGKNAAKGSTGDHQRSSELHFWYGLIRAGLVPGLVL